MKQRLGFSTKKRDFLFRQRLGGHDKNRPLLQSGFFPDVLNHSKPFMPGIRRSSSTASTSFEASTSRANYEGPFVGFRGYLVLRVDELLVRPGREFVRSKAESCLPAGIDVLKVSVKTGDTEHVD
jgi:hypothetical protein